MDLVINVDNKNGGGAHELLAKNARSGSPSPAPPPGRVCFFSKAMAKVERREQTDLRPCNALFQRSKSWIGERNEPLTLSIDAFYEAHKSSSVRSLAYRHLARSIWIAMRFQDLCSSS